MGSAGGITNTGQFDLMKLGVYSILEIDAFVQEMTPKLFEDFQNMEIDELIKSKFYL